MQARWFEAALPAAFPVAAQREDRFFYFFGVALACEGADWRR